VIGETTAIDKTSSATSTVLPHEYLENIPTGRFQPDTLNLAPGINLDSAYGGGGSSANSWQIDGVDTSDPEGGSAWSFVNYDITGRGADAFTPLEATVTENAPEWVWYLSLKSVLSANAVFKVSFGGYTGYYYLDPQSGYNIAGHYDAITGEYSKNSTYFFLAD